MCFEDVDGHRSDVPKAVLSLVCLPLTAVAYVPIYLHGVRPASPAHWLPARVTALTVDGLAL